MTVEYQSVLYDVKIERMGRMAGPGDVAKQTITIKPSVPLHEGLEGNDLILALVGGPRDLRVKNEVIARDQRNRNLVVRILCLSSFLTLHAVMSGKPR